MYTFACIKLALGVVSGCILAKTIVRNDIFSLTTTTIGVAVAVYDFNIESTKQVGQRSRAYTVGCMVGYLGAIYFPEVFMSYPYPITDNS